MERWLSLMQNREPTLSPRIHIQASVMESKVRQISGAHCPASLHELRYSLSKSKVKVIQRDFWTYIHTEIHTHMHTYRHTHTCVSSFTEVYFTVLPLCEVCSWAGYGGSHQHWGGWGLMGIQDSKNQRTKRSKQSRAQRVWSNIDSDVFRDAHPPLQSLSGRITPKSTPMH